MINREAVKKSFEEMKKKAAALGAEVELSLSEGDSFSAVYQDRKLKKYSSAQNQNAQIRVLHGTGVGLASTENLDPEALLQSFEAALESAKHLDQPGPNKINEVLIADAGQYPDPQLFHSDYEEVPVDQRLAWAEGLEADALNLDKRITNVPYSGMNLVSGLNWILNSKGLDRSYKSSSITGSSYAIAKEGEKAMSGYSSFFKRDPKAVEVPKTALDGANRALSLLGAVQPKTGMTPVLLMNDVAAEMIGIFDQHLSAKALDEGTSLLKGRLGEQILSEKICMIDDPLRSELPGARPFDGEGAPSKQTPLFEKGVLKNFLTNSYYARKLNLPNTSNAVQTRFGLDVSSSNLCVEAGTKSFEDLVAMYPEVIVITEATGFHSGVNGTTGDFSLPAYGYLYKNGKLEKPLEQFVISGNLFEAFKDVADISNRLNDDSSSVRAPDILFHKLSVAGATSVGG